MSEQNKKTLMDLLNEIKISNDLTSENKISTLKDMTSQYETNLYKLNVTKKEIKKTAQQIENTIYDLYEIMENLPFEIKEKSEFEEKIEKNSEIFKYLKNAEEITAEASRIINKFYEKQKKPILNKKIQKTTTCITKEKTTEELIKKILTYDKKLEKEKQIYKRSIRRMHNINTNVQELNTLFQYIKNILTEKQETQKLISEQEEKSLNKHLSSGSTTLRVLKKSTEQIYHPETTKKIDRTTFLAKIITETYLSAIRTQAINQEYKERNVKIISCYNDLNGMKIPETQSKEIKTILTEIIKNAQQFTYKGTIKIGLIKQDKSLEIYVKDTGLGIPFNKRREIFEEHTTIYPSERQGLGLTIVEDIAKKNNWEIKVDSKLGKGTKFSLYMKTLLS